MSSVKVDKTNRHEVKVISETDDSLTIDFVYTYSHETPAEEIKLFISSQFKLLSLCRVPSTS